MTDAASQLERLRALVAEAYEAGTFAELEVEWRRLFAEHAASVAPAGDAPGRFGLIGDSPQMHEVFDLIERVAPTHVPVLVLGETGTGKELVARAVHSASPRAAKPFLAENCAAVPAALLESELFGHKKGAFTDAIADRKGTFAEGHLGTVFLDEIGDMPLEMQSKLLRVLQDGEIRPVGSNKVMKVDVRLVAATHRDLAVMCAEKSFREDLFFRINVVRIDLPPLRDREGDVALLARTFVARLAAELGREVTLGDEAIAALEAWSWPGNVRELENELQRAAVFCDGRIRPQDLSPRLAGGV